LAGKETKIMVTQQLLDYINSKPKTAKPKKNYRSCLLPVGKRRTLNKLCQPKRHTDAGGR